MVSSRALAACRRRCPISTCSRPRIVSRASRRLNPIWRGSDMEVLEQAALRQAKGQTFALATVVRTVSVTAAKAGAKALIGPDGSIEEGWIGGGWAGPGGGKAARQCMVDG